MDPKVNDEFDKWLNKKYGEQSPVTSHRGKVHDYLGMTLNFSEKGKVIIDVTDYAKSMLQTFSIKFTDQDKVDYPSKEDLLEVDQDSPELDKTRHDEYRSTVAKALFMGKRARPDLAFTISFLCTRTRNPTEQDWTKLVQFMKHIHSTQDEVLTLWAGSLNVIKWHIDASFAVHPDFRSHTGGNVFFEGGGGAVQTISTKQKLNTRSSTEAELVGADDGSTLILWTKLFLEAQGYPIDENILCQDNKSAILLEKNGKRSSGKRARAINIRYFFLTDQVAKGNLSIMHCPTDDMIGDYMTKPLSGDKFRHFRDIIMGKKPLGE